MDDPNGFSLVETITCAAIICLMALISYPSVLDFRNNIETKSIVTEMVADLQYAKIEAIKENCYVVVQLARDGYKIFIDNGEGNGKPADWQKQDDEQEMLNKTFSGKTEISSNFVGDHIRFRGVPGIKAGTINLRSNDNVQYEIVLSRAGRIRFDKIR